MGYTLVTDDLIERLTRDEEQSKWLFLEPHPEFIGQWAVNSFDPHYFFDFQEVVGPYRAIAPSGLEQFIETAVKKEYEVAFFEDPGGVLTTYERLNEEPVVQLTSDFEGTINGFLPFQVQGFNFLKDLQAGVAMWSTGTGKTVLATALLKYHIALSDFDTAFFVVKAHNKVNTQRALLSLGGIEGTVIQGEKKRRRRLYADLAGREGEIIVTNYEKFRDDHDEILPFFENTQRVLCIWDEMPAKLKTRTSQLYKAVCRCLYTTNPPAVSAAKLRPRSARHYMLAATPIENNPSDWFNCVRLMDPPIYGTVKEFETEYVRTYDFFDENKPSTWHKLDKMGLVAAHITHQVDKDDPDIAAQFPEVIDEKLYIDWEEQDRKLYDRVAKEIAKEASLIGMERINPVALISVLQMLCDAPSMMVNSAAVYEAWEDAYEFWAKNNGDKSTEPDKEGSALAARIIASLKGYKLSDEGHSKLNALRELLCESHPNEKVLVFSALNKSVMPVLEAKLREWNVTYVRYTGTDKRKQSAEDQFMTDPDIQVFLTSDMGADSLNLEAGSVVIHYDLPWKWSTKIQRQNRVHRVTSEFEHVTYYTLMMANSVEDRKLKIVEKKQGYHQGVFKGAIADQSASARMTREDLMWILTGR